MSTGNFRIALTLVLSLAGFFWACRLQQNSDGPDQFEFLPLEVTILGKEFVPDSGRVIAQQRNSSRGGSTSVRNISEEYLEWKTQGYFQRNRDLGQVFRVSTATDLRSVVLRTGPSDKAVLKGAQGQTVFMQFFEVTGVPVVNDNGTPAGTTASHGFSPNHRCDDFIEGVEYIPLSPVYTGKFPAIPATDPPDPGADNDLGKLVYMRWTLEVPVSLQAGKRYAFIIGFRDAGAGNGFTFANANLATDESPPGLTDSYSDGWGIRREGDGTLPPLMIPGDGPPADEQTKRQLISQSLFSDFEHRLRLSPTTDGYPDVDTYRDLEFILEK